jgi:branched-chain amino acid aminotransferase
VSEATGENLFMLRSGALVTPPLTANILAGITRATVLQIAEDLGVKIEERMFARDELYVADEVFLTGTAAEVTPVRSIDRRRVGKGKRGPLTETIQSTYFDIVGGKSARYAHWLTHYTL